MIIEIFETDSINQAILNMNEHDILILNDGIYNEKLYVTKNKITIKAKNPGKSIIQNGDYYHKIMSDNNECNTFRTYTVYIGSDDVTLDGLHIKNTSTPSKKYGQAVALHVDGDRFKCINSTIESAQDTLFTGPLPKDLIERYNGFNTNDILKGTPSRQLYIECTIIGDVDYIFGCATALFKQCNIITIDNKTNHSAFICAPSHPKDTPFGYLFLECNITNNKPAYLGRPWRDFGCAAFISNTFKGDIIPEGFNKWNNTNRDKTARFFEYSQNIDLSKRESWINLLTADEANNYVKNFFDFLNSDNWF